MKFTLSLVNLDDVVLDDIYQYHLPPRRRVPPLLWARIRSYASSIVLAPKGAQEMDKSVNMFVFVLFLCLSCSPLSYKISESHILSLVFPQV